MRKLTLIMLLCIGFALTACGGGGSDNSSQVQTQQAQISALQGQLTDVQTQLAAAQAQSMADEAGINTAIVSLTGLQTTLEQLAALGGETAAQKTALKAASNQVLVLQALADSLTATGQQLATACTAAKASIASLTSQLAASQGDSADLATQLATANAQVTTLTEQLAASQGDSADLVAQLATASAQVTTLTEQLAIANAQVTTLTGQIATLTSAAASLQSQLDTGTTTIATRDATIVTLNSTITTLNATIANMVATPIIVSTNPVTAVVFTNISVTASFPVSQAGKTATFSTTGGTLAATSVTIAADGSASTTFSSAAPGTFNIYAVQGLYAGGVVVTIMATPAATYSISGTITLNSVGQPDVIVALTGTASSAAFTDANGTYSFAGLPNGNYTVTPWPGGAYIYPGTSLSVTISDANATGKNFSGRWHNNLNGTVTDKSTGLVWLKNANCAGVKNWDDAISWAASLASGTCGLSDSSVAGSWRVPTIDELVAVTTGTEQVRFDTPQSFSDVRAALYWSFTSTPNIAWAVNMIHGNVSTYNKIYDYSVWPVRAGQ